MNLLDKNFLTNLLKDIESNSNRDRRAAEYKSFKVSDGAQLEYVENKLKELFPKSFHTMRVGNISISKKILDRLAAYTTPPARDLSTPEKTIEINNIYDDNNFNASLQEFDRCFNRQKYALLWVNKIGDQFRLISLAGYESYTYVNNDTGELELVALNYNLGDDKIKYSIWTKEQYIEVISSDGNYKIISDDNNPNAINPLGLLPFIFISRSQGSELPFLNPITDQSIESNILITDILTASSNQGHGQLVVRLPEGVQLEQLHTGQATALNLPIINDAVQQADAQYINANPDLSGMMEVVYQYIASVLDENGLSNESLKGGTSSFSSGIERMIAQADAQRTIRSNQAIYAKVEQQIVNILSSYFILESNTIFLNETVKVTFERPKVLVSDSETISNIEKRLSLGLMTKVQALQALDPNLSKESAQNILDEINLETNKAIGNVIGNNTEKNNIA